MLQPQENKIKELRFIRVILDLGHIQTPCITRKALRSVQGKYPDTDIIKR